MPFVKVPTDAVHEHTMACFAAQLNISLYLLIACLQYRWLALRCTV